MKQQHHFQSRICMNFRSLKRLIRLLRSDAHGAHLLCLILHRRLLRSTACHHSLVQGHNRLGNLLGTGVREIPGQERWLYSRVHDRKLGRTSARAGRAARQASARDQNSAHLDRVSSALVSRVDAVRGGHDDRVIQSRLPTIAGDRRNSIADVQTVRHHQPVRLHALASRLQEGA